MSNQTKAIVAEVKIGTVSIEGLMLPDGTFAVGVSQLSELNLVPHKNSSRDLKAILGNGFQFLTASSELNPKKVNILTLPQVEMVITQLAFKGNQVAQSLMLALIGLSLQQLFCDSFGMRFESQDRQDWLTTRQQARVNFRPKFTDWLKQDGCVGVQYPVEVNRLKSAVNLPKETIDTYDTEQITVWKDSQVEYNMARRLGLSHQEALIAIAVD
jgi:hypothetical protein